MASIDVISTIPFDTLVMLGQLGRDRRGGTTTNLEAIRTLRILRLIKLLRILRARCGQPGPSLPATRLLASVSVATFGARPYP